MESKLEVTDDCGECINCKDKPKFGGPNKRKLRCQMKKHNKIRHRCSKKQKQILYQNKEEKGRRSASSQLIESNPVTTIATFLCQESQESLTIVDYLDDKDPVSRRYKAQRNGTDPLVIQIFPLQHTPDHVSSSLCLGTPEADILPVLARSRVSVTEVVTMFLIEASGGDIVYRSRACNQLIPSLFKTGKCDSCLGLIENIKHLARAGENKSEIKGEYPEQDFTDTFDQINFLEDSFMAQDDPGNIKEPLIIHFTKKKELREKKLEQNKIKANTNKIKRYDGVQCEFCTKILDPKNRRGHMRRKHFEKFKNEYLDELNCPFCEETFQKGMGAKRVAYHFELFHQDKADTEVYTEFMERKLSYLCPKCGSYFANLKSYSDHARLCKEGEKEVFSCHICGKSLHSRSALRAHLEKRHTEDPCVCQYCGKSFINQGKLKEHTMRCLERESKEEFKCHQCEKKFNRFAYLSRHFRQVHTKQKNHACDQCGKRFFEDITLQEHITAVHDKLKPFICEICGVKTAKIGNLMLHRKKTHQKPSMGIAAFWEVIQKGEHPYIDNSYELLHLIKPRSTTLDPAATF